MNRDHRVTVRLTSEELARLDARRAGLGRAGFVRRLIRGESVRAELPSHQDSLEILAGLARDGVAAAAVALERALRPGPIDPVQRRINELAEKRRAREAQR